MYCTVMYVRLHSLESKTEFCLPTSHTTDASHSSQADTEEQVAGTRKKEGKKKSPQNCLRATGSRIIHAESSCRVWSNPKRSMTVWALVMTSLPAQHPLLIRQSIWDRTGRQTHKHRSRDMRQRSGWKPSPVQPTNSYRFLFSRCCYYYVPTCLVGMYVDRLPRPKGPDALPPPSRPLVPSSVHA